MRIVPIKRTKKKMKQYQSLLFVVILGATLFVLGCAGMLGSNGWEFIAPGPNLEGWTIVDVPADGPLPPTTQWSMDVNTSVLQCSGKGGRDWLCYDKNEYTDFILHAEWRFDKLSDEKARYNSGVFIRNAPDWSVWHHAQLGSTTGGYL